MPIGDLRVEINGLELTSGYYYDFPRDLWLEVDASDPQVRAYGWRPEPRAPTGEPGPDAR